jgi:hypothetical protein
MPTNDPFANYVVGGSPDPFAEFVVPPSARNMPEPDTSIPSRADRRRMFNAIPLAGAALGAVLAGPGGAVTGGVLGKGAQEYALQFVPGLSDFMGVSPRGLSEQAAALGREGATQLGNEALGGILAGVVRHGGRGLMRTAIPDAGDIERNYGVRNIVDVLERERIGAGRGLREARKGMKPGSERMQERAFASSAELEGLLADAEAAGLRYTAKDMVGKARQLSADLRRTAEPRLADRVDALVDDFINENSTISRLMIRPGKPGVAGGRIVGPGGAVMSPAVPATPPVYAKLRRYKPIGASRAGKIERGSAGEARDIYRARRNLEPVDIGEKVRGKYHKAVADELRDRLSRDVPGFAERNRATRDLLAAVDALQDVERVKSAASLRGVPALVKAATPLAARGRPFVQRAGLAMTNPYLMEVLRATPRLGRYLLFPSSEF